jgi:type II secretory pathway component PulM
MNAIARALAGRSPGERLAIAALAAIVAIAAFAAFVWLPLERARSRLAAQLPALRASIAVLEREGEEAKRLKAMPPIAQAANAPLASLAGGEAKPPAGAQVTVVDPKTVSVTASDVAFGALLEWLAAVQSSQGLRVESARVDALPVAGRVRAELRLTRS